MFKKRLAEIKARRAEIRKALTDEPNLTDAQLDEYETELRNLATEESGIERRTAIASGIADGEIEGNPVPNPLEQRSKPIVFTRETVLSTPEYRSAWAKTLMHRSLDEVEKRALETAMTTTSTTYVEPSANADGVNNGGLFIPTNINTALLEAISLISPIFRDVARTNIPGLLKFPYKVKASGAKNKKETEATADGAIQWADLVLSQSEICETIRVSWKLERMSVDGFIEYITNELIEQVRDKTVTELIYGKGGDEELKGATVGALTVTHEGSPLDAFNKAFGKLGKKEKIGAKLYVSRSIIESVSFEKDDNGAFVFNPINSVGVKSIATYPVEVDPYLNDGDFIFGNLKRHYRLNVVEDISIAKDSSGKKRANDYTAYCIMAGAAQPSTLVYGKVTAPAAS